MGRAGLRREHVRGINSTTADTGCAEFKCLGDHKAYEQESRPDASSAAEHFVHEASDT